MTLSPCIRGTLQEEGGFSSCRESYSCYTICWGERGMKCCSVPVACPECTAAWWLWSPGLHCGPSDVGTPLLQTHTANGALTLHSCPPVSSLVPRGNFSAAQQLWTTSGPGNTANFSAIHWAMITISARRSSSSHGDGPFLSLFFLVSTSSALGML